ncbi:hypothetical protein B0H17DRAFT_1129882 [Mycena rosella]|uniref:Uncharacterized protein n=1 Tax=Mycena rosella TaxID=1033263 RepID=A0AAD7DRZ0_MYCRO|nr:hypothetical protein B0H17DRAFT_1129882 [Mycena rosella]
MDHAWERWACRLEISVEDNTPHKATQGYASSRGTPLRPTTRNACEILRVEVWSSLMKVGSGKPEGGPAELDLAMYQKDAVPREVQKEGEHREVEIRRSTLGYRALRACRNRPTKTLEFDWLGLAPFGPVELAYRTFGSPVSRPALHLFVPLRCFPLSTYLGANEHKTPRAELAAVESTDGVIIISCPIAAIGPIFPCSRIPMVEAIFPGTTVDAIEHHTIYLNNNFEDFHSNPGGCRSAILTTHPELDGVRTECTMLVYWIDQSEATGHPLNWSTIPFLTEFLTTFLPAVYFFLFGAGASALKSSNLDQKNSGAQRDIKNQMIAHRFVRHQYISFLAPRNQQTSREAVESMLTAQGLMTPDAVQKDQVGCKDQCGSRTGAFAILAEGSVAGAEKGRKKYAKKGRRKEKKGERKERFQAPSPQKWLMYTRCFDTFKGF